MVDEMRAVIREKRKKYDIPNKEVDELSRAQSLIAIARLGPSFLCVVLVVTPHLQTCPNFLFGDLYATTTMPKR